MENLANNEETPLDKASPSEDTQEFTKTSKAGYSSRKHLAWVDRFGAFLAGLCAIHCFAFAMGSVVLGFTASSLFFNPGLRWLMVFLVAILTTLSLFGRGRHNQNDLTSWLLICGLAAIISANLWGIWGLVGEVLSIFGGLILASGHWAQLSKSKKQPPPVMSSKGLSLPGKFSLLLLLIASAMTISQLPSLFRVLPAWSGGPKTAQADKDAVGWAVLSQLDVLTGEIGPDLAKVVGTKVKVPGFIVPLDEGGRSFLLAPYAGACVHGPTPPMNQIIYVEMQPEAKSIDPWSWEPIWVTGQLKVLEIESPFGSVGFTLDGIKTEIYR